MSRRTAQMAADILAGRRSIEDVLAECREGWAEEDRARSGEPPEARCTCGHAFGSRVRNIFCPIHSDPARERGVAIVVADRYPLRYGNEAEWLSSPRRAEEERRGQPTWTHFGRDPRAIAYASAAAFENGRYLLAEEIARALGARTFTEYDPTTYEETRNYLAGETEVPYNIACEMALKFHSYTTYPTERAQRRRRAGY